MTMDFFTAQEAAKKRTAAAVVLFALGVAATAGLVFLLFAISFYSREGATLGQTLRTVWQDYPDFGWTTLGGAALLIVGASIFKILTLQEGGVKIAESLGARMLDPNTSDEREGRLMNVVEEMALASGYGVPQVGVLDREGRINAFAAGRTPQDAVVVVTRGALEKLDRDELQAVVGHEFSHLLNGDSRLNINLAGWVFGLFFLTIVGRVIMRGSSRSRKRDAGGLVGLIVFLAGLIGWFFGRIIQALISRQREYLADASSVQFTRNPPGMIGALAKIRAEGSRIDAANASGLAHFFFASAAHATSWTGLLATHPPLEARLRALDENYELFLANPKTPQPKPSQQAPAQEAFAARGPLGELTTLGVLVGSAGVLDERGLTRAAQTLEGIPEEVNKELRTEEGAQAVILGLLLGEEGRDEAFLSLQGKLPTPIFRRLYELDAVLRKIPLKERLPIMQVALGRAKLLPKQTRLVLAYAVEGLITMDGVVTPFEAFAAEMVAQRLGLGGVKSKAEAIEGASKVLTFLFMAQKDAEAPTEVDFRGILADLALPEGVRALKYVSAEELRKGLAALTGFNFVQRRELLIAAGRIMKLDKEFTPEEAEILRALAMLMECPLPIN